MWMVANDDLMGNRDGHPPLLPLRLFQGTIRLLITICHRRRAVRPKSPWLHSPLFQVVQEYERAVIFRLGRLLHGGSRGPGNR